MCVYVSEADNNKVIWGQRSPEPCQDNMNTTIAGTTLQIFQIRKVCLVYLIWEKVFKSINIKLIIGSVFKDATSSLCIRKWLFSWTFVVSTCWIVWLLKNTFQVKHEKYKAQPVSTAQLTAEESAHLIGWGLSSAARFVCVFVQFQHHHLYIQSHNILLAFSLVISLERYTVIIKLN